MLAVVSQKGGVGKTTTAINVAAALARRGTKVLLIDADPQGAVEFGLGLRNAQSRAGLSDYLIGSSTLPDIVRASVLPWLRVVTAGSIADETVHEQYQRRFADSGLVDELFGRARQLGYLVVVDTPPGLGPIALRVLGASQHVIVPLQCEPLALQTTTQMLRGIRSVIGTNPALEFEGVLLTMYESGSQISERVASYVRQQLPKNLVFDMAIPRTNASVEAFAAGQPLVLRAPEDPAALAYEALVDALARRLQ